MKKLTIIFGIAIIGLLLFTTSCGPSSPSDVAISTINNIQSGNTDDVIAALSFDGKELSEEDITKFKAALESGSADMKKKGGIKSLEVINETINDDGSEAEIELKTIFENGEEDTEPLTLVKEDGVWKIAMYK